MRRQNGPWLWLLLLFGTLIGLWLLFYPAVNRTVFRWETARTIQDWEETLETARETGGQVETSLYPELHQAMTEYNRQLAENGQAGLTGPEAYEAAALHLPDYGLEEDTPVAVLSIPTIGLELPVYLGATQEHFSKGAAVLGETSLPIGGEDTNCVLAGHRGYRGIPYFRHLDRLERGDLVYLTTFWGKMAYAVTEAEVIQPNEIEAILIREGEDLLTLLTCHPYTVGTHRLVIYCERRA